MNFRQILTISISLLILAFAFTFWYANQYYNNAQLALKYYEEPKFESINDKEEFELVRIVKDAFSRKNYERVMELAVNIPPDIDGYWEARILLGHAFLKEGEVKKAVEVFTEIVQSEQSDMKANAALHRILAHVSIGNESQTIHFLEEVKNSSYRDSMPKVNNLESDLNGFWRKLVVK